MSASLDARSDPRRPPTRWPARGTSSTCAISSRRRCARCWTSRPNYKRGGASSRPLAGKTLALIFEKPSHAHARLLRGRHAPARRRRGRADRRATCRAAAARRSPTPRACCRAMSMRSCCAPIDVAKLHELARIRHRAGDQRPDRHVASLPAHGRRDDVRGASRADRRPGGRLVRRRQQRARAAGSRRRCASASRCAWRRPDALRPPTELIDWARAQGGKIELTDDPEEAVAGARCVVTDTWVSMADDPNTSRHNLLAPYRVDQRADGEGGSRTRSSCTACRRIAARRSPPR